MGYPSYGQQDKTSESDLDNWFTYHPPQPGQPETYQHLRAAGQAFAATILDLVPPGEERRQALRDVRSAVMWSNAAIACSAKPTTRGLAQDDVMLGAPRSLHEPDVPQ